MLFSRSAVQPWLTRNQSAATENPMISRHFLQLRHENQLLKPVVISSFLTCDPHKNPPFVLVTGMVCATFVGASWFHCCHGRPAPSSVPLKEASRSGSKGSGGRIVKIDLQRTIGNGNGCGTLLLITIIPWTYNLHVVIMVRTRG